MKGIALVAAIWVGLFAALALLLWAFGLPVGESLANLWHGAVGDQSGLARTLVRAAVLALTGLGVAVAWRSGAFNIGGEGQFIVGGLAGATVYRLAPNLPPVVLTPLLVASCALGGAAYAWIAGWMYARRGVQVVISTILLNFIALQLMGWAVNGPLKERQGGLPQSDSVPVAVMFLRFNRQTDLHAGVFLAAIAVVLVAIYLYRTARGFELRVVGENPFAARAAHIDAPRTQMRALALSGALCGLAAACDYIGISGQIDAGFSQQWGFLGIPVALVGGLNPFGVGASALFFGGLFAGSDELARSSAFGVPIVYVVQGVATLGATLFWVWARRSLAERRA